MNIYKIFFAAGILLLFPFKTIAQITPDGSTSTTVENNGNVSTIEAGERAGANLFHSFDRFSVQTGNEAFFNNAADINNIFSRVTGGSVSNINGLIRANNANLFLINPAGVIFGNGARLDIGGAFYGGSADSILFPDGVEFGANDTAAPILTINAPIGLNFRDEPAPVSIETNNLTVVGGRDLNLFGGTLSLSDTNINALGGNINLSAVSGGGTVGLNENLDLDFSNISSADISLTNSQINVGSAGGGEIEINARNLSLSDSSILNAGINADNSTPETQAGNVIVNAEESVTINSGSIIRNNVSQASLGNAGNILITAKNLSLADNSRISTISFGNGNTGAIALNIAESTALNGTAEIKSEISEGAVGNSNNIAIDSGSLSLTDNSKLLADVRGAGEGGDIIVTADTVELTQQSDFSTNLSGQGSAGNIDIQADDSILLQGSTFQTTVLADAEGSAGSIDLNTGTLVLTSNPAVPSQSSRILASTFGTGDAGEININSTNSVSIEDDSSIQTQVELGGVGNAGNINITTTDLSLINGTKPQRTSLLANTEGDGEGGDITINASGNINLDLYGLILSQGTSGTGDAGDILITSDTLSLISGSSIVSTTGDPEQLDVNNNGLAGNINIDSRITTLDRFSGISTSSISNAIGEAGNLTLNSDRLTIAGGSGVSALTENNSAGGTIEVNAGELDILTGGGIVTLTNGEGDAGDINLNVARRFTIDGANPLIPPEEFRSPLAVERELETVTGLFANTTDISTGNGGNVRITTPQTVSLFNSGQITVDSEGAGNGGNLFINARSLDLNSGSQLIAQTENGQEAQEPSNINLQIEDILSLKGDSQISARAFNTANGGNVNINADFVIAFSPDTEGNDIIASARGGEGGKIDIVAREIFGLAEGVAEEANASNDLDVSSELGIDGTISISNPDVSAKAGIRDLPVNAINPGESVQQTCSANSVSGTSSLNLQGRGGIPARPTTTLSSDDILFEGEFYQAGEKNPSEKKSRRSTTQLHAPIATAQGEIYPAKGVSINQAGEIILTRAASRGNSVSLNNMPDKCLTN